jgi:hypothetical protein
MDNHTVFVFYSSASDRQGQFKMPACKPSVPLEDVFSQDVADFETSYLEVICYVKLTTGYIPKLLRYALTWSLIQTDIHHSDHANNTPKKHPRPCGILTHSLSR